MIDYAAQQRILREIAREATMTVTTMPKPAANSLEGKVKPYLDRVEKRISEIETIRSETGQQIRQIREDIQGIYKEAKNNGLPHKALRGLVKHRELERRKLKIIHSIPDIAEKNAYVQLAEALGPLGEWAAKRGDNW